MNIQIKPAKTDEDLKSVAKLADIIWHEYFSSLLSLEQIDYMVDKFQSYTAIKNVVDNDGYLYYMAYDGNDLCGYLGIHDEGEGVIFISKLYVRSDKRKNGIASSMLDRLKRDYPYAKKWYLTVNKYNSGSIAVYEKRGFSKADAVVTDIGGGFVMDDYIMERTF